jgi:gluconokinase
MASVRVVVMGVSGSGKSTVGGQLAKLTGWSFLDADTLHPPANVAKMARGEPLVDADRWPWLDEVAGWIAERRAADENGVVGCSALKRAYRDRLREVDPGLRFVFLAGSRELLVGRLTHRHGHFFPTRLLDSQLAELEPPGDDEHPIVIHIGQTIGRELREIVSELQ